MWNKTQDEWVKRDHPMYTYIIWLKWIHMSDQDKRKVINTIPRTHRTIGEPWKKWYSSLVSPSISSNNMYELMHGWEILRFKTLEEAKLYVSKQQDILFPKEETIWRTIQ